MAFSSMTFLCVFFPLTLILYYLIPQKALKLRNIFLMIVSLLFYAYGEPVYVLLMLFCTFLNYICTIIVTKRKSERAKKTWLILCCVLDLAILGVFKYTDMIIASINSVAGTNIPLPGILLPIGISFFTFQAMSYTIDVYRGNAKCEKNFFKVLLYISFFPQLIAGPIVRYKDIADEIDSRNADATDVAQGIRRFVLGLSKKVIISNALGLTVDSVYALDASRIGMATAWLGAFCYMMQIFFDFSGYSDMAIGLGRMFGFHFKENFNYPYVASTVQDFWRRWHISLTNWFREYLYIPLGGNRKGKTRTWINRLIVFFSTGLWHGASWNFVVWGLYHGLFLTIETLIPGKKMTETEANTEAKNSAEDNSPEENKTENDKAQGKHSDIQDILKNVLCRVSPVWSRIKPVAKHIYVLLVVLVGFVFFRAETMSQAGTVIFAMFAKTEWTSAMAASTMELINGSLILALVLSVVFSLPVKPYLAAKINGLEDEKKKKIYIMLSYAASVVLMILCLLNLAGGTYNPFIYFRF